MDVINRSSCNLLVPRRGITWIAVGVSLRIGIDHQAVSFPHPPIALRLAGGGKKLDEIDALIPRVSHGATLVMPLQGINQARCD